MGDEKKFCLKFVKSSNNSAPKATMTEAFTLLKSHEMHAEWLEHDECLKLDCSSRHTAFVVDHFDGNAFQHLMHLSCRVYGAQCILSSLNQQVEMPLNRQAIFNVAMRGVIICCTSLQADVRNRLHRLVQLMAGDFNRDLVDGVTHVVASSVGSEKYSVAADMGTPIMLPDWVEHVWEASQDDCNVHGMDPMYASFRCPVFKGVVLTVSGLSADERREIKHIVESEGGTYTGEMKMKECTHLILKERRGQKYDYACKWKVHVVSVQWLQRSVELNCCQNVKNFPVVGSTDGSKLQTSTPELSRCSVIQPNLSDVSAISTAFVDETAVGLTPLDVTCGQWEPFLAGCCVYISRGICGPDHSRCLQYLHFGGATMCHVVSDKLTHVLMEQPVEDEVVAVASLGKKPWMVSVRWLEECCRRKQRVDEDQFQAAPSPPTSTSTLLTNATDITMCDGGQTDDDSQQHDAVSHLNHSVEPPNVELDGELLSQYLDNGSMYGMGEPPPTVQQNISTTGGPDHAVPMVTSCGDEAPSGLPKYAVGRYVDGQSTVVADYGVVPLLGCLVRQSVAEVVTDFWLQMCAEHDSLLPVNGHPAFRPLNVSAGGARPLQGCVLSVSGYTGVERDCLVHVSEMIGAICQEHFVRRPKKPLLASTHLVAKETGSEKYKAAIKWNIPVVSRKWLFACAETGMKVGEADFGVDTSADDCVATSLKPKGCPAKLSRMPDILSPPVTERLALTSGVTRNRVSDGLENPSGGHTVVPPDSGNAVCQRADQKVHEDCPGRTSHSVSKGMSTNDSCGRLASSAQSTQDDRLDDLFDPMASIKVDLGLKSAQVCPSLWKDGVPAALENSCGHIGDSGCPDSHLAKTPTGRGRCSRVQELQAQSERSILSPSCDSPSVFLVPGYRAKFHLSDVMDYLKSPDITNGDHSVSSPSVTQLFEENLEKAAKKTAMLRARAEDHSPFSQKLSQAAVDIAPLAGVIISVGKKLAVHQTEYNSIVAEVGGDYQWKYSKACTHFIFQGRQNDMNKEYRVARSHGKMIVSPYWLFACRDDHCRVDESMYPHNYNPNMNLGNVVKTETPSRGLRRSARKTPKPVRGLDSRRCPVDVQGVVRVEDESMLTHQGLKSGEGEESRHPHPHPNYNPLQDDSLADHIPCPQQGTSAESRLPMKTCQELLSGQPLVGVLPPCLSLDEESAEGEGLRLPAAESPLPMSRHEVAVIPGRNAVTESMEIRNALDEALEKVKASSGGHKKSGRKKQRRIDFTPTDANLSGTASHQTTSPWKVTPGSNSNNCHGDASQSLQVTWDDPTGRKEKERLADKLEVLGPHTQSQDTEDFMAKLDMPDVDFTSSLNDVTNQEKLAFVEVVERLGGQMLDRTQFDPVCTHLVIDRPTRNEKFLAAVATGRWVLHKAYLLACQKENRFVPEEDYEWGGPAMGRLMVGMDPLSHDLVMAAHTWRLRLQRMKQTDQCCHGAFDGWIVILLTESKREENFQRLLMCGGANVLDSRQPFIESSSLTATHAFVELHKVKVSESDLTTLAHKVTHILRPEFIAAYLVDPGVCPTVFTPPEVEQIRARMQSQPSMKRRPGKERLDRIGKRLCR